MEPDDLPNRISDYDILLIKNDELKLENAMLNLDIAKYAVDDARQQHIKLATTLAKKYKLGSSDKIDTDTGTITRTS